MKQTRIEPINSRHPLYRQVWDLREAVLRRPLGLSLRNEDLSMDEADTIFVALQDDARVAGCVMMHPLPGHKRVKLRAMAVYPDLQGSGLGRLLVQAAEAWAWQQGFETIVLHARKAALGFYERLGYEVLGAEFTEVGIPHRLMQKHKA
jgi:N-acetylglutamate synthase-like GNAT family acetyltransferase